MLKQHKSGKNILVVKNKYYYNSNLKSIYGINFLIVSDKNDQIEKYKKNKIHITCNTLFPYERLNEFIVYDDF